MTALVALIRKDLLQFFADRRALIITLLLPIVLGAFFGYLFGGSGKSAPGKVAVALVIADDSSVTTQIADKLRGEPSFTVTMLDDAEATRQVRAGKQQAAVVFPAGFGDAAVRAMVGAGPQPPLDIRYDPSQTAVLQMVKGLLTQHAMSVISAELASGVVGGKLIDDSLKRLEAQPEATPQQRDLRDLLRSVQRVRAGNAVSANKPSSDAEGASPADGAPGGGLRMPFTTHDTALSAGPGKYNGYAHSYAGMAVQFILFMAIDAGVSVLLARRQGLWNRLRVAPVSLRTLLTARLLSCALIALMLLAVIYGFAMTAFGVRIDGSVPGFVLVCVSFALMTASFGLLIAAFGRTPEAARGMAIFATLILVMLGGAWVPSFIFPQWMQSATLAVPTRWSVDGLDAMTWRGLGFDVAAQASVVQLGFAAVFAALAFWRFGGDER